MRTIVGASRPDHIAELTRGVYLPLNALKSQHLIVILETITSAWQELCATGAATRLMGDEAEVNALLHSRLNHYCQSHPLWKGLVVSVTRGGESLNYDGSKLEKRPDLSFVLLHGNSNFPMVVECKIIDHPNKKSVTDYCKNGIARFVGGDYAWASREAVMLAYVRDGTTVPSKLSPHLASKARLVPDPFQTTAHPSSRSDLHPTVHHSVHQRSFSYPSVVNGTAPGPISLFHLWL